MSQDGLFTEEYDLFRKYVTHFVDTEIIPHRVAWEKAGTVPREIWLKAGAAGLLCCDVPEKYGGMGGNFLHNIIVTEEMTAAGGGGPAFVGHSDVAVPYISRFGTEQQKQEWLPKMVRGEVILAIGMTEPSAGSDLQAIRTTARREGDEFVINGQKVFITNGEQAHLLILACKTDRNAGAKGISLILVETDRPGYKKGRMLEKIGRKAQDTSELFFSDVSVPVTNLLGTEGRGFAQLMQLLAQERLCSAARAVSVSERALRWTIDYVNQREAFGKKLSEFQNTQFLLADLWSETLIHRVFVNDCIAKHLRGELTPVDAAAAKLRSTELEGRVIDECLQLFGGWGYMWEYPIARAYADARVDRISAGSNHILKMVIGREVLRR